MSEPRRLVLLAAVLVLLVVAVAALPQPAGAQPAVPVLDILPGGNEVAASSTPRDFQVVGNRLFFTAEEPSSGRELWVSDGTAQGTELLADLCPGSCSSSLTFRGSFGDLLLFTDAGGQLWRSDGTRAGTFALAPHIDGVALLARSALFVACGDAACSVWTTDGTVGGTRQVNDFGILHPGFHSTFQGFGGRAQVYWVESSTYPETRLLISASSGQTLRVLAVLPPTAKPRLFTAAAGHLFFLATQEGEELWASDGTTAGTAPLTDFSLPTPFAATTVFKPGAAGVYFAADDGKHGVDLWKSDGTRAGTVRVTALAPDQPFVPQLAAAQVEEIGGQVVVIAYDERFGYHLFASSGTPASTTSLGGMAISPYTGLQKAGERLFFRADDGSHGYELWSTDGTPAGTALVRDLCRGACDSQLSVPQAMGDGVVFLADDGTHGTQVWTSDGSAAGTTVLTALPAGALFAPSFKVAALGSRVVFTASDLHGEELWTAGADAGGGQLVENIAGSGHGSRPLELTAVGPRLVFTACDGISREVWASAGSGTTTYPVSAFRTPGSCLEPPADPAPTVHLTGGESVAYFGYPQGDAFWLWRTDGSPGNLTGTPIAGLTASTDFAVHGGVAYFALGRDLWRSDATAAGSRKVATLPSESTARSWAWIGAQLYLGLAEGLYRSDGISAELVAVSTAPRIYDLPRFTQAGGRLFFIAADGLWTSDGSAAGTRLVAPVAGAPELVEFGGKVYFLVHRTDPSTGELWRSDGTAAGTVSVARFADTAVAAQPAGLVVAAGRLFFVVTDGAQGSELWTSDGTAGGTVLVRDIDPGTGSSSPTDLTAWNGRLYFAAAEGVHGRELWESDGSAAGTRLAQDVAPQGLSSDPRALTAVGGRLFFTADDGLTGRELWVLPATAAGCQPAADRLCLGGGRFAVTVAWRDFAGNTGNGQAIPLTADTGGFWFFSPSNLELAIKVLDGRALNNAFWVFYGALSTVEYAVTVTDTQTGLTRRYENPPGRFASVGDTFGFGPLGAFANSTAVPEANAGGLAAQAVAVAPATCTPSPKRLCLNGGRFAVEATWQDFAGNTGTGQAVALTGDTGSFWFFAPTNLEVFAKVLDGRGLNGKFWFFYGALSSVDYRLTVTDTETGAVRVYHNPSGRLASVGDTDAF